jgi:hypothetical protein
MPIALAWLATGAAERLQLPNNADRPHHWLLLTMHPPTPLLPIELNLPWLSSRKSPSSNSSIAPFSRLTKPPHSPSFQTDLFHNCSSIPSHNSAPPIGLHAHLVAAVTQASLYSIAHTHTQQSFPCSGNAKAATTETNGPIKQTWFPWLVSVHKVGWPIFALQYKIQDLCNFISSTWNFCHNTRFKTCVILLQGLEFLANARFYM